ncbi:hypothetical protein HDU76_002587 [Blyttiomyces sp. JEL0837]|nr:hypothetical protein HDU76_002587 [Blyttiomyces sp. JEL0837]
MDSSASTLPVDVDEVHNEELDALNSSSLKQIASSNRDKQKSQLPNLPLELWGKILFHASSSLEELSQLSTINRSLRSLTWDSTAFQVSVLQNRAMLNPRNSKASRAGSTSSSPFNWEFFSFYGLPNGADILKSLMASKLITPVTCPYAIMHAQHYKNEKVMLLLLENGFPSNPGMIVVAASKGHADIIEILLRNYNTTNTLNQTVNNPIMANVAATSVTASTAITAASSSGHTAIVTRLLDAGVPTSSIALREAASHGHAETVRLLLNRGVEIHPAAVREAARAGHREVVRVLLEGGAVAEMADIEAARLANNDQAVILDMLVASRESVWRNGGWFGWFWSWGEYVHVRLMRRFM